MNNILFSSNKEDWATPLDVFNTINMKYKCTLDVCCNIENKKWIYNIEEIIEMKFLEKISYEDLEKQYKEFIIEKM